MGKRYRDTSMLDEDGRRVFGSQGEQHEFEFYRCYERYTGDPDATYVKMDELETKKYYAKLHLEMVKVGAANGRLEDEARIPRFQELYDEADAAVQNAKSEVAAAVRKAKFEPYSNPPISITNSTVSTLQDIHRFVEDAIRGGNSYDQAIEAAYKKFPHSLVNQATGRL